MFPSAVTDSCTSIEEYARHTLCYICGHNIENLFCNDKSDIRDRTGEYGIEVVRNIYKNEQEREVFIEQVWNTPYDQIDPQKINRFQRGGGKIIAIENKIHSASIVNRKFSRISISQSERDIIDKRVRNLLLKIK